MLCQMPNSYRTDIGLNEKCTGMESLAVSHVGHSSNIEFLHVKKWHQLHVHEVCSAASMHAVHLVLSVTLAFLEHF